MVGDGEHIRQDRGGAFTVEDRIVAGREPVAGQLREEWLDCEFLGAL